MFSNQEQYYMIQLARRAIENYFVTNEKLKINRDELLSKNLEKISSCFVTLHLDGKLRGCIGHTEPDEELYKDIIKNAVSAAFFDPRFLPLTESEYKQTELEISVLSMPQKLEYTDCKDLLSKLRPSIDGIIIKQGDYKSTYLPQVWKELSDGEDFLSSLCKKAGLASNAWQQDLDIFTYQVEVFDENVI